VKARAGAILVLTAAASVVVLSGASSALAGDAAAGQAIFQTICHKCHAALPYTGRIGVGNLPAFLANPRRYKPTTAMTFPGLKRRKDIDDVIAYITQGN
jgi:cytochrome c2